MECLQQVRNGGYAMMSKIFKSWLGSGFLRNPRHNTLKWRIFHLSLKLTQGPLVLLIRVSENLFSVAFDPL